MAAFFLVCANRTDCAGARERDITVYELHCHRLDKRNGTVTAPSFRAQAARVRVRASRQNFRSVSKLLHCNLQGLRHLRYDSAVSLWQRQLPQALKDEQPEPRHQRRQSALVVGWCRLSSG